MNRRTAIDRARAANDSKTLQACITQLLKDSKSGDETNASSILQDMLDAIRTELGREALASNEVGARNLFHIMNHLAKKMMHIIPLQMHAAEAASLVHLAIAHPAATSILKSEALRAAIRYLQTVEVFGTHSAPIVENVLAQFEQTVSGFSSSPSSVIDPSLRHGIHFLRSMGANASPLLRKFHARILIACGAFLHHQLSVPKPIVPAVEGETPAPSQDPENGEVADLIVHSVLCCLPDDIKSLSPSSASFDVSDCAAPAPLTAPLLQPVFDAVFALSVRSFTKDLADNRSPRCLAILSALSNAYSHYKNNDELASHHRELHMSHIVPTAINHFIERLEQCIASKPALSLSSSKKSKKDDEEEGNGELLPWEKTLRTALKCTRKLFYYSDSRALSLPCMERCFQALDSLSTITVVELGCSQKAQAALGKCFKAFFHASQPEVLLRLAEKLLSSSLQTLRDPQLLGSFIRACIPSPSSISLSASQIALQSLLQTSLLPSVISSLLSTLAAIRYPLVGRKSRTLAISAIQALGAVAEASASVFTPFADSVLTQLLACVESDTGGLGPIAMEAITALLCSVPWSPAHTTHWEAAVDSALNLLGLDFKMELSKAMQQEAEDGDEGVPDMDDEDVDVDFMAQASALTFFDEILTRDALISSALSAIPSFASRLVKLHAWLSEDIPRPCFYEDDAAIRELEGNVLSSLYTCKTLYIFRESAAVEETWHVALQGLSNCIVAAADDGDVAPLFCAAESILKLHKLEQCPSLSFLAEKLTAPVQKAFEIMNDDEDAQRIFGSLLAAFK